MKNIGIIVDNEFNNDIRVRKEVEILKKSGHNIHVLCFAYDKKTYPVVEDINVCRVKIKKSIQKYLFFFINRLPFYDLFWKSKIKKFIKENAIDVLHVHDLYMSKSAHLALKSQSKDIPLILDLHENYPHAVQSYNWGTGWVRYFLANPKAWIKKEAKYLIYASKLVVLSESFKQDLLKQFSFISKDSIVAFPNVIDFRRFEQHKIDPKVTKSDRVTLMYFGGISERRGIFETLTVLEKGIEKGLNIELLIIGPIDRADNDKFLLDIKAPKIKEYVTYIPWIDLSELITYMHISDIFLSPIAKNKQHESGVANKIFQYMYGAKPIIVSNCKPQQDLIESFNCGLAYATQEEYLDCITTLVNNKALRAQMGANGFKKLHENYDHENYEKILLELYND
jgi:glycosyltransferase involved in cell wall biosynthesis